MRIPMIIGYKVGFDPKVVNGNQKGEFIKSLPPLELAGQSPYVARMLAISFVQAHPFVYLGGFLHRLVVFLIDYEAGKEYLIHNNKKPSKKMLANLEKEFHIYVRSGYSYSGWQLVSDKQGNAYRIIINDYG